MKTFSINFRLCNEWLNWHSDEMINLITPYLYTNGFIPIIYGEACTKPGRKQRVDSQITKKLTVGLKNCSASDSTFNYYCKNMTYCPTDNILLRHTVYYCKFGSKSCQYMHDSRMHLRGAYTIIMWAVMYLKDYQWISAVGNQQLESSHEFA